jgi:hypothetical protein
MKNFLISIVVILALVTGLGYLVVEPNESGFCKATVDLVADEKAKGRKSYDVQRDLTVYIQSHFTVKADADRYVAMSQDIVRRTYRNNNPMEACQ